LLHVFAGKALLQHVTWRCVTTTRTQQHWHL